jgi:hypothetical protein
MGSVTLATLSPDQRAVLELVLRQNRDYGELAVLLDIPEAAVRSRAHAAVRGLAGDPPAGVDAGAVADWLLGQRAEPPLGDDARRWASTAAARLREIGGDRVPEVRAAGASSATSLPRPSGDAAPAGASGHAPRSSRLGGVLVLAAIVLVVGLGLAWLLTRGGDSSVAAPVASAPAKAAAAPCVSAQSGTDVLLCGVGDAAKARGALRLLKDRGGVVRFAIGAQDVPPNRSGEVYAVWFAKRNGDARLLGYTQTQVGDNGVLTTGGPQKGQEKQFPGWFATYDVVLVTKVGDAKAGKPGAVVLQGTLPHGASG